MKNYIERNEETQTIKYDLLTQEQLRSHLGDSVTARYQRYSYDTTREERGVIGYAKQGDPRSSVGLHFRGDWSSSVVEIVKTHTKANVFNKLKLGVWIADLILKSDLDIINALYVSEEASLHVEARDQQTQDEIDAICVESSWKVCLRVVNVSEWKAVLVFDDPDATAFEDVAIQWI